MSKNSPAYLSPALLCLTLLTAPGSASDLKFDGQVSVQKEIGTPLSITLTGNPSLPAFVLMDTDPGPLSLLGESLPLGFTPNFFVATGGTTDASGVFSAQLALAYDPSLIGGQLFGLGVVLDPADPNGYDFSSGADLTIIPNQAFYIVGCSFGCSPPSPMAEITCGQQTMTQNEHLTVSFSMPVELASVNSQSFRIASLTTGAIAAGQFTLDPNDPKTLLFDPQLSFDSAGVASFGFIEGETYLLLAPGRNHDVTGSFLRSTTGEENANRLTCTGLVSGVTDFNPGPPTVTMIVDVVTAKDPVTGAVLSTAPVIANAGIQAQGVWLESDIRFGFDDLMDVSTLVDPASGSSPTIETFVDLDGDPGTTNDQVAIDGTFSVAMDTTQKTTELVFDPSSSLPPAGSGVAPRLIIVRLGAGIADLAGNALSNPAEVTCVPDSVLSQVATLPAGGEDFTTQAFLDADDSGALWGAGLLAPGEYGASGRLGVLRVLAGAEQVLDTGTQVLTSTEVVTEGSAVFPPSSTPPSTTVTGGVFEFSRIELGAGASLRFVGPNPARLFARGDVLVEGGAEINVAGQSALAHDSELLAGAAGGLAQLGAGGGGQGGDRPDETDLSLLALGGLPNHGAQIMGSAGGGVGGTAGLGNGLGGTAWPVTQPTTSSDLAAFFPDSVCKIDMVAGQGSGGGYATAGGDGLGLLVDPGFNPKPPIGLVAPNTVAGAALALTPVERSLDPELGLLRGGSGGGGGGLQYLRSQTNGFPFGECKIGKSFKTYWTHSAAAGGAGGGALQLQAGGTLELVGVIVAAGGVGGSANNAPLSNNRGDQAAAGGGGSGGAILLQADLLSLQGPGPHLSVVGGSGGTAPGTDGGSKGGKGGGGLVRAESSTLPDPFAIAQLILPFDPTPGSETGGAASTEILSTATLSSDPSGPEGLSGAVSAWIQPAGPFFEMQFVADDFSNPTSPILGWDFDVYLTTPGSQPFSYRDANDPANPFGVSIEALLGSDLGGVTPSPLVVRFQGVHAKGPVAHPSNVDLEDPNGPIAPDSVTAWVRTPAELGSYWTQVLPGDPGLAAARRPNMLRFQVIFDGHAPLAGLLAGITNFGIDVVLD